VVRYNIYVFDREGGVIVGYHPFEVTDDAAAIAFAAAFTECRRPMELWREETLVQSWSQEERYGQV